MNIPDPLAKRLDPEPLALRPRDAARVLSISERTLARLTKHGLIPARKLGRLVLYDVETLRAFARGESHG